MKTIEEIDKQIAQLKAKKMAMTAREGKLSRNVRTRQQIILGGWLLANDPQRTDKIKSLLTRAQDRAAFALPLLTCPGSNETSH